MSTVTTTTLDRNLAVAASAGTGKTFVLVQRFLHILEHCPDWPLSGIVVLTFTNLAAQEMRNRILREVASQRQQDPDNSVWHSRTEELHLLQVSTVHSFCESLLRRFAIEAHLDPDFRLLDEGELEDLQQKAIRQTFAEMESCVEAWLSKLPGYTRRDLQDTLQHAFSKRSTLHHMLHKQQDHSSNLSTAWQKLVDEEFELGWSKYEQDHPEFGQAQQWLEAMVKPGHVPDNDKLVFRLGSTCT